MTDLVYEKLFDYQFKYAGTTEQDRRHNFLSSVLFLSTSLISENKKQELIEKLKACHCNRADYNLQKMDLYPKYLIKKHPKKLDNFFHILQTLISPQKFDNFILASFLIVFRQQLEDICRTEKSIQKSWSFYNLGQLNLTPQQHELILKHKNINKIFNFYKSVNIKNRLQNSNNLLIDSLFKREAQRINEIVPNCLSLLLVNEEKAYLNDLITSQLVAKTSKINKI